MFITDVYNKKSVRANEVHKCHISNPSITHFFQEHSEIIVKFLMASKRNNSSSNRHHQNATRHSHKAMLITSSVCNHSLQNTYKTGNLRIKVTHRRVRVTTVAVEKK